jgi:hypothetical protein
VRDRVSGGLPRFDRRQILCRGRGDGLGLDRSCFSSLPIAPRRRSGSVCMMVAAKRRISSPGGKARGSPQGRRFRGPSGISRRPPERAEGARPWSLSWLGARWIMKAASSRGDSGDGATDGDRTAKFCSSTVVQPFWNQQDKPVRREFLVGTFLTRVRRECVILKKVKRGPERSNRRGMPLCEVAVALQMGGDHEHRS